jgi:hypothetical protein
MLAVIVLGHFFVIETESRHRLTLSGNHYVRVFDKHNIYNEIYIAAEEVTMDHLLMVAVSAEGHRNHSVIYSPIVSITKTKLVGVYNVITYSGSLIVSRIVASCYVNDFGSHQHVHMRCSIFRLWKSLATMLNFTPYTDEFHGIHPVFKHRLLNFIRKFVATIYDYTSLIYNGDLSILIFVSFISMLGKIMFYLVNRSIGRLSTSYNRCSGRHGPPLKMTKNLIMDCYSLIRDSGIV